MPACVLSFQYIYIKGARSEGFLLVAAQCDAAHTRRNFWGRRIDPERGGGGGMPRRVYRGYICLPECVWLLYALWVRNEEKIWSQRERERHSNICIVGVIRGENGRVRDNLKKNMYVCANEVTSCDCRLFKITMLFFYYSAGL